MMGRKEWKGLVGKVRKERKRREVKKGKEV